MDTRTIIIILAIVLLLFIILNHVKIVKTETSSTSTSSTCKQGSCSQTIYGCCPDGVNSKIDYYGTNCPGYKPPPGYPLRPNIPGLPPKV
jgi:hypothetical protein